MSKFVMAGLVPAIHVLTSCIRKDVDARHKAGHDELKVSRQKAALLSRLPFVNHKCRKPGLSLM
jgi:hypothetical protein